MSTLVKTMFKPKWELAFGTRSIEPNGTLWYICDFMHTSYRNSDTQNWWVLGFLSLWCVALQSIKIWDRTVDEAIFRFNNISLLFAIGVESCIESYITDAKPIFVMILSEGFPDTRGYLCGIDSWVWMSQHATMYIWNGWSMTRGLQIINLIREGEAMFADSPHLHVLVHLQWHAPLRSESCKSSKNSGANDRFKVFVISCRLFDMGCSLKFGWL